MYIPDKTCNPGERSRQLLKELDLRGIKGGCAVSSIVQDLTRSGRERRRHLRDHGVKRKSKTIGGD
jgi:hypothetical protein